MSAVQTPILGGYGSAQGQSAQAAVQNVQWYTNATTCTNTVITTCTNATMQAMIYGTGAYMQTGSGAASNVYVNEQCELRVVDAPTRLVAGTTYDMPDGSKVIVELDGGFHIDDKDAKVIYRAARVRDFNPFLNASDLIEEYIGELVPQGIRQDEVLHLEIEHFIYWLVCKAAERDNDQLPADLPRLPDLRAAVARERSPRCGYCGQYIRRVLAAAQIYFCSPIHMEKKLLRICA